MDVITYVLFFFFGIWVCFVSHCGLYSLLISYLILFCFLCFLTRMELPDDDARQFVCYFLGWFSVVSYSLPLQWCFQNVFFTFAPLSIGLSSNSLVIFFSPFLWSLGWMCIYMITLWRENCMLLPWHFKLKGKYLLIQ